MYVRGEHVEYWVGVDISKASFDVAVAPVNAAPGDWAKLPTAHFAMDANGVDAFAAWLTGAIALEACVGVCIESTGMYSHRFAQLVSALGLPEVSMVNPALPVAFRKSFGLRDKCDRVDAAVLALYGVVHRPKANTCTVPEYAQLKALWRLYEDYTEDLLRWKNRLEQAGDAAVKKQLRRTIRHLEGQRNSAWKSIEEYVRATPTLAVDAELMCSIPGIGMKTAVVVLAEYGDVRTWTRNQFVSYAGLYPKVYSSGTSVNRKPTLARGGGKRLRKALFLPACTAARYNAPLAQWREQLIQRGKNKMAATAALMRKLLALVRAVVISGIPFDQARITKQCT